MAEAAPVNAPKAKPKAAIEAPKFPTPSFDMPKFDVPSFEVPPAFREFAEKGVSQAKEQYEKMKSVAEEATGVMEDTYANASKGAAHILTLQMARELTKKHGITVFGISPNKLKGTGMSRDIEEQVMATRGWTAEFARQYQLNSLLAGEETDPAALAEFIAFLLHNKERHKFLTGCILPYGA